MKVQIPLWVFILTTVGGPVIGAGIAAIAAWRANVNAREMLKRQLKAQRRSLNKQLAAERERVADQREAARERWVLDQRMRTYSEVVTAQAAILRQIAIDQAEGRPIRVNEATVGMTEVIAKIGLLTGESLVSEAATAASTAFGVLLEAYARAGREKTEEARETLAEAARLYGEGYGLLTAAMRQDLGTQGAPGVQDSGVLPG